MEELKFIYSEKATKSSPYFWLKSKVKISQNFVDFSEHMNFNILPNVASVMFF